jgi:hypothetical protein
MLSPPLDPVQRLEGLESFGFASQRLYFIAGPRLKNFTGCIFSRIEKYCKHRTLQLSPTLTR